jgi:hypothetical protein
MNPNLKQILYAVFFLAAGLLVGRLIGAAQVYQETSGAVAEQYFHTAAANLATHLSLLELLQSNQGEGATRKLARLLDADLMALSRYSNRQTKELNAETAQLIRRAREYRRQHPSAPPK